MGRNTKTAAWLGTLLLAACGGGGGQNAGGAGGAAQSLTGDLAIRSHTPANAAVQVALNATIELHFDGVIVNECLTDADLWLVPAAGGARVAGALVVEGAGRDVRFTPSAPLAPETDYVFHLSPFVCDTGGRILAEVYEFGFRTLDERPPTLTASTVSGGANNVDRLTSFSLTFDEALDPASVAAANVYLRDVFGRTLACDLTLAEPHRIVVDPRVDLAGDRTHLLIVNGGTRGITDRAGNVFANAWSASFRTALDVTAPRLTSIWPAGNALVSPLVQPRLGFDESVDPASIEAAAVRLTDSVNNVIGYTIAPRADQRELRIVPEKVLLPGETYTITVAAGVQALTDVTGNVLTAGQTRSFTVGTDAVAPVRVASQPAPDAVRVSISVAPQVTFDETIEPASLGSGSVTLSHATGVVGGAATLDGAVLTFTPSALLAPAMRYELRIAGGPDGIRDLAGNTLATDLRFAFTTTDDSTLPGLILLPAEGAAAVPIGSCVSAVFDAPIVPATVTDGAFRVTTQAGATVPGTVQVLGGDRVIRFQPLVPWTAGAWYRVTVAGGPSGIREASGNWLQQDTVNQFRIGTRLDVTPPVVRMTLNNAADARKAGMQVPPAGFTVDVHASDPVDYALDPGTLSVEIIGAGVPVTSARVFAMATLTRNGLSWRVPADVAFPVGEYQLIARGKDLSGNETVSPPLTFQVVAADSRRLPFERTHVVWVRADLDRDGSGLSDLLDDLIKLGLAAAGDPAGLNDRMLALVRDAIVARTNQMLGRRADGAALGPDAVAMRLSVRRPLGVAHMQIALGGLDPEGPARRVYGAESTGVLGRAFFDRYNGQVNDQNIASRPGLGVFPGEMFLFQAEIHRRVYPGFVTTFARRFLPLSPEMGGTPVGRHPEDATVVAASFDYGQATPTQRVRHDAIFAAADDWAAAIGVILAHEIGHSIGLVADGASPIGLHGDISLHNDLAGSSDVMSAAVGYDSLVLLDYSFRDLNIAYLRQRLVLR